MTIFNKQCYFNNRIQIVFEKLISKKIGGLMKVKEILRMLKKTGAIIINSHVVYTSGKHGENYINKDAIFPHTKETSDLCRAIAELFIDDGIDVVIAPATSGCILSNRVAEHLTNLTGHEILSVYAEKQKMEVGFSPMIGRFIINRGYDKLVADKRVLVVEDVLTTGSSVKEVIEAVRAVYGNVIGLGALVNRGGVTSKDVDVPKLISLVNLEMNTYNEADCPLCAQSVPINIEVGHGKEYLDKKNAIKRKFFSG